MLPKTALIISIDLGSPSRVEVERLKGAAGLATWLSPSDLAGDVSALRERHERVQLCVVAGSRPFAPTVPT
jgi:hypothetical protein